jgi:uncharacterized protein YyaL (SSP411 family)
VEQQLEAAVARLADAFDRGHGGWGGAPKFPAPMTVEFLLRSWHRRGDAAALDMATVTLDRMASGGINDQLGGGFARYSTDAHWLVPHFEKMLYDNAQLAHAYLEGYRATGNQTYAATARATLDFMLRELLTDEGGFASALDADSDGEEGRFYTWQYAELVRVVEEAGFDPGEVAAVTAYFGVAESGNWEGRNVLSMAHPDAAAGKLVERARGALLAAREGRARPARDEKQLAAWNGMALRALAHAALVLADDGYAAATRRLVDFVRHALLRDDDRLWRTARGGVSHTPAFAEDYAMLAEGLLAAYAAGGDAEDLRLAERLMRRAIADFWDADSGTLYDTGPEHDLAVTRPRSLIDNATPAANSVAAEVLQQLALLTGDEDLVRRARSILRAVSPALDRQPSALSRALSAADRAIGQPLDAVIAGDPADPAALELRRAVARPFAPDLVIAPLAAEAELGDLPIFTGKGLRDGRPTAYVCRGYACDEPTADPERAAAQVAALGR